MAFDKPEPDRFKRGDRLGASDVNEINNQGVRHIGGPGVSNYGKRVNVNPPKTLPGLSDHRHLFDKVVVREVFDDYLMCVPLIYEEGDTGWWDSISFDPDRGYLLFLNNKIFVAKTTELQRIFYDGKTFNLDGVDHTYTYLSANRRSVTSLGGSFIETMDKPYYPGAIITVMRGVTGLLDPVQSRPILYSDSNEAARKWTRSVQLFARVTGLVHFTEFQTGTHPDIVTLDPCGRAYAVLEATEDGCNWNPSGGTILLAPINSEPPFVYNRRYPCWFLNVTTLDITPPPDTGTGNTPPVDYDTYLADPNFTDDCANGYTGAFEVLVNVTVECVANAIVTTKTFKTLTFECGKLITVV